MPQLNPEFFVSQLFWLAVFFSFLFIFLWRVSLPRIAKVLEKRQNRINENLTTAKELQEKAQKIEESINNQIKKAKEKADDQIKITVTSLQDEVAKHLSSLDKELDEKVSKSEKEIIKSKNEQMQSITKEIVNITKITISKITDLNLSDDEIEKEIKTSKGSVN